MSLFHGPVIMGAFVLLFILILDVIKKQLIQIYNMRINFKSILIILALLFPIILYLNSYYSIPYIGNFTELKDINHLLLKANVGLRDDASYPSFLIINNYFELIPKIILKMIYFLYSPFIWDVHQVNHIIGLLDGLVYFILTILLFKNWRAIWTNPVSRIFLLIFICYLIVYSFGLGNFGTVIRHRSKFAIILIILAAPKILKLIFKKTENNYKVNKT